MHPMAAKNVQAYPRDEAGRISIIGRFVNTFENELLINSMADTFRTLAFALDLAIERSQAFVG